jgi:hypothetical protein
VDVTTLTDRELLAATTTAQVAAEMMRRGFTFDYMVSLCLAEPNRPFTNHTRTNPLPAHYAHV